MLKTIQNFYPSKRTQKIVSSSVELFDAIAPFVEKPSIFNVINVTFKVTKFLIESQKTFTDMFFDNENDWQYLDLPSSLVQLIVNECLKFPTTIFQTIDSEENGVVRVSDLGDVRVGWITPPNQRTIEAFFIENGKYEAFYTAIRSNLQRRFEGKSIVVDLRKNFIGGNQEKITLQVDNLVNPLPSKIATEFAVDFKKAINVNENRSLLLYGPPGTGKSTIAQQISNELNLFTIRFKVETLNYDCNILMNTVNVFRPDCVIIDDLDRSTNQFYLLNALSELHRITPLIIATANNREKLDEAIMRPERFDEIVFVKNLDNDVILKILEDTPTSDKIFDLIKNWPIVFIQEYVRRRKWLPEEKAINTIKELADRVKRLQSYNDNICTDLDDFFNVSQEQEN